MSPRKSFKEDKLDILLKGIQQIQSDINSLAGRVQKIEQGPIRRSRRQNIPTTTTTSSKQAVAQPLDLEGKRLNLFEDQELMNLHKEDIEIDKKLSSGKQPTKRGLRQSNMKDVECCKCHQVYKVSESLLTGKNYKCNDCIIQ